jgi:hypothetical protein
MSSSSSSRHFCPSLHLSFSNMFQKAVLTHDVTNPVSLSPFLLSVRYSSPPWLYVTLLHFPHDRSNWSRETRQGVRVCTSQRTQNPATKIFAMEAMEWLTKSLNNFHHRKIKLSAEVEWQSYQKQASLKATYQNIPYLNPKVLTNQKYKMGSVHTYSVLTYDNVFRPACLYLLLLW